MEAAQEGPPLVAGFGLQWLALGLATPARRTARVGLVELDLPEVLVVDSGLSVRGLEHDAGRYQRLLCSLVSWPQLGPFL